MLSLTPSSRATSAATSRSAPACSRVCQTCRTRATAVCSACCSGERVVRGSALTVAHLPAVVPGAGGQPLAPVTRALPSLLLAALLALSRQTGAVGAALLAVAMVRAGLFVPPLAQLDRVQPVMGMAEAVTVERPAQGGRAGLELASGRQDA